MLRTSVLKVRQVRRRAVDWLALAGKVSTDGARTDVNRLRDLYDEINAAAKMYEGEPAAIDFAQYRKDISAGGIVDEMEVSKSFAGTHHVLMHGRRGSTWAGWRYTWTLHTHTQNIHTHTDRLDTWRVV